MKRKRPPPSETVPEVPPSGIFSSSLFSGSKFSTPSGIQTPTTLTTLTLPRPAKEAKIIGNQSKFSKAPQLVKDRLIQNVLDKVACLMATNERRCNACPLYGKDLVESVSIVKPLTNLAQRLLLLGNILSYLALVSP